MVEHIPGRFDRPETNPYHALQARLAGLYANYTDDELALLLDFLHQTVTIYDEEALRLRTAEQTVQPSAAGKPPGESDIRARMVAQADMRGRMDADAQVKLRRGKHHETRKFSTPRGELRAARLEWNSGAVRLNVSALRGSTDLYHAEFRHDIPIVRDQNGIVSVQYRHRTLFGRGGGDADVKLNSDAAWDFKIECGASHIEADLRELTLNGLELKSKASRVTLLLPPPNGTVPIRIEGGASHVRIERPRQSPVRLEFEGDWSTLRFDRKKFNVSNEIRESPDYRKANDKYWIQFVGGGSKLTVEEGKQ
jgi:hypothetical protein